jgi:hypothetical protein
MLYSQFESAFNKSFDSQQKGINTLFDVFKEDAITRIFQLRETLSQLQSWMKASWEATQCFVLGLLFAITAILILPIASIVTLLGTILMPLGMIAAIAIAVYGLICRVLLLGLLITLSFLSIVPITLMAFGSLITDIWTWTTKKFIPATFSPQYFAECEEIYPETQLETVCSIVLYEQQGDIVWVNNEIGMQRSLSDEVISTTPSLLIGEFILHLMLCESITAFLVNNLDSFPLEALQVLCEELGIEVNPEAKAKNLRKKIRKAVA